MTPVEFHFVTPDGAPCANLQFDVQLGKSGFDLEESGVLMPRPIQGTTNSEGKATVNLWHSPQLYYVTAYDTESEAGFSYKFLVPKPEFPGAVFRLQDIVLDGDPNPTPWNDAALLVVQSAKANAMAAAAAAQTSSDTAQAAADGVLTAVDSISQDTKEQVLALNLQVTASVTSLAASVTRMSTKLIQNELTA